MTKEQKIATAVATIAMICVAGIWIVLQKGQNDWKIEENQNGTQTQTENRTNDNSEQKEDSRNEEEIEKQKAATTSIEKDLESIDAQIKNLDSDSSSIEQGLNDQMIEQEQ